MHAAIVLGFRGLRHLPLAAVGLLLFVLCSPVLAVDGTWSGPSSAVTGVNWTATGNWTTSPAGSYPTGSDATATLNQDFTGEIRILGPNTIGHVNFTDTTPDQPLTLTASAGDTLTFAGTNPSITIRTASAAGNKVLNLSTASTALNIAGTDGLTIDSTWDSLTTNAVYFGTNLTWTGFTGTLTLAQGNFQPQASNTLPTANRIVLGTGSNVAALDVRNGRTTAIRGLDGNSLSTVYVSSTTATGALSLGVNTVAGDTYSFAGKIGVSGAEVLNVTLNAAGGATVVQTFSNNASLYNGTTTVTAGTLRGTAFHAFGDTSLISVAGGAVLDLRSNSTGTFAQTTSGTGYAIKTTSSGATINVDRVSGSGAVNLTIGTLDTHANTSNSTTTFTGSTGASLITGAVSEATAAAGGSTILTNNLSGGGSLTLASFTGKRTVANTLNFNGTGNTTITGSITEAGGSGVINLLYNGSGVLTLNGAAGWTGTTIVRGGGALQLTGSGSLSNGNLLIGSGSSGSGVLLLGNGNFARNIGTGAGQVQILSATTFDSGFGATGADRTVTLNGGADLTFGSTSFVVNGSLLLGDVNSTHKVTLTNNFTGASVSVRSNDGSAAIDGGLSGNISGSVGFTKSGSGTLELTGTNTYSSTTTINGGVLLINSASALSTGRVVLAGGVLGLGAGDYTRILGGTSNTTALVGSTGASGFAAFNADRIVNLGGAGVTLVWSGTSSNFFSNVTNGPGDILVLNVDASDAKLTFQNGLNLNGSQRTLRVGNGSAAADAAVTGVISGTGDASGLTKDGNGKLELTAANSYQGATTIAAGTLRLSGSGRLGQSGAKVTLASGTSLELAGNVTGGVADGIFDAADLELSGTATVALSFSGTETISALKINGVFQSIGTWGATGSGAQNINDTVFSGGGLLNVTNVPEPSALALLGLAAGLMRRRRRGA